MKFYAFIHERDADGVPREKGFHVEAPAWHVARAYAWRELGDGADAKLSDSPIATLAELRWAGSDAGTRPNLHVEVRTRKSGRRWSSWRST